MVGKTGGIAHGGSSERRYEISENSDVDEGSIQELIDAVSGATWQTRNRIMQGRFFEELDAMNDRRPSFRPAGEGPE